MNTDEKVGCFMLVWFVLCAIIGLATSVGCLWLIYLGIQALSK